MQAYPSNDRYYSQQPGYGQPQYYQQFPGYGGYAPTGGSPPIAAPFPVYPTNGMHTPATGRPRPLDRELSRSSTPGKHGLRPLKSAMKRTRTPDHASLGEIPLARGRSADSTMMYRQRTRSGGSRMRSSSVARPFVPDHIVLTLRSTNQMVVENLIDSTAADELSEQVLPIWQQGINYQRHNRGKWKAEFSGSPWASAGLDAILAGRMIIRAYTTLARLGYFYLSTVNVGSPWKPPQMVFAQSEVDPNPTFFSIMISKSGDRLTILDCIPELTEQLSVGLRSTFPRQVSADRATEDGLHIFEVKRGYGAPQLQKSILVAFVLKFFNNVGFRMSGSVPMGTRSFLHLGQRREMWMFRYVGIQRPGRDRENGRRPSSRQSRQSHGEHSA